MFRLIVVSSLLALAYGLPNFKPRVDGRIVGGKDVEIEDYPHQVSLLSYGSHICGGSVFAPNVVITAAHCTDRASASSLSIRAGSSIKNDGGVVVKVKEIRQNPKYDPWEIDSDVTVLILESDLDLSGDKIKAIKIAENRPEDGEKAEVSGWGAVREGGASSKQLQSVEVDIVNQEECAKAYKGYSITDTMICAGVNGGGKDACQGDSGGPLISGNKLVGVVSWGVGCARPNYPGVYSSVANLKDFILEQAKA